MSRLLSEYIASLPPEQQKTIALISDIYYNEAKEREALLYEVLPFLKAMLEHSTHCDIYTENEFCVYCESTQSKDSDGKPNDWVPIHEPDCVVLNVTTFLMKHDLFNEV